MKKDLQFEKQCGKIHKCMIVTSRTLSAAAFILKIQEVLQLPNIKSAKKRVIVNRTKALRNKMFKTQLKTIIKKYDAALASGDKEAAMTAYKAAVKKIDQAVGHGILHKNNAARKKSSFTLKLNQMA